MHNVEQTYLLATSWLDVLNFPLINHFFLLTFSNIFSYWNRNWANFLLSHVCQTGWPLCTNWLTVVWFLVQKELFYTDCQRWSYLFESCAVLSLMKIHKKPHVSISEDGTTVQHFILYNKSNYACILIGYLTYDLLEERQILVDD